MTEVPLQRRTPSSQTRALFILAICSAGLAAWSLVESRGKRLDGVHAESSDQGRGHPGAFVATPTQWAALGIEPVTRQVFRSAHVTEGKIAVDEERSTLIFSP